MEQLIARADEALYEAKHGATGFRFRNGKAIARRTFPALRAEISCQWLFGVVLLHMTGPRRSEAGNHGTG